MKIVPVGAELFHADGRTDMTKLTVFFFFAILRIRLNTSTCTCPRHEAVLGGGRGMTPFVPKIGIRSTSRTWRIIFAIEHPVFVE